ncbi:carboxymuconolactone decarboxylase family protein [Oceanicaulis sp. LC35]|uniref:carboxymuconolactone decarboxylase family protein n=1 Tax=Oceanicaulis sp. LC35 TaxID=3349635 RepID=UPI003F828011
MTAFTLHTAETAPEAAKPLLENSLKAFGMVPGLHAVMAESPELLDAYQRVHTLFQNTSFNAEELTVVWQTINVENQCHYCVPAHSFIAKSMKVDDAINEALRNETPLPDARLEALRTFTLKLIRQHGVMSDADLQDFYDAGFTRRNVLEVILGYSQKVMSNFTNHVAHTPVDAPFAAFAWTPKD